MTGNRVVLITIGRDDPQRLVTLNATTGHRHVVYRVDGNFTMTRADARAGRAGIELIDEGSHERVKVVSVPLSGGRSKQVALADPRHCYEYLGLAGVGAAGEVVTDEIGCHDPGRNDPGKLFAYAPGAGRFLFGTTNVPQPERLQLDAELEVVGDHWLTVDEGLFDRGPERVYVTDRNSNAGRRLVKVPDVKGADMNEHGDAIAVVGRPDDHPSRPFRVLFFPHREAGREVASTKEFPQVRLCGRGLAILEWANRDRTAQRLRFEDVPGGTSRQIFRRPRRKGYYGIQTVACDERWYAWEVDGLRTTVGVESLRP
jgi:hypothetical protein